MRSERGGILSLKRTSRPSWTSERSGARGPLIRPILAENDGWAAFFFTPNGRNHGYDLYQQARANPEWFGTLKTVEDTRRDARGRDGRPLPGEDGRLIIPVAQVVEEIRASCAGVYARVLLEVYARDARERGIRDGRTGTVTVIQRSASG